MGFYFNGKFNLIVSLRYTPVPPLPGMPGEFDFLREFFSEVSNALYNATEGQHSIATVQIASNSVLSGNADICIWQSGLTRSNSTTARLWYATEALDLRQDDVLYPTLLAHELAHYLYDLRDEYVDGNNAIKCQPNFDNTIRASLMQNYPWSLYCRWTDNTITEYSTFADFFTDYKNRAALLQPARLSEFCHAGNHDALAVHPQNILNNRKSCWEWMADDANHAGIPYNLTEPVGDPNVMAPAPAPTPPLCIELIPIQRYMLVLDRSYSMHGRKINQLIAGTHFWVDYVSPGEELGLVQFNQVAQLITPTSEVPLTPATQAAWRNTGHTIVNSITASGNTAIGDGLRTGLRDLLTGGSAASQVIILFSDGRQNRGLETAEEVLPDAIAANVPIFTIGVGGDQDVELLTHIATLTGGLYFGIPGDIPDAEAAGAISDALVYISGHTRANSEVISDDAIDESAENYTESFKFPVDITKGSSRCTLGVKWYSADLFYTIKVTDPDGNPIGTGTDARLVKGKYPYTFYDINNPKPGRWSVEVIGDVSQSKFRTIGFEVHDKIRFELNALKSLIEPGEKINLRARLLYFNPLPGVNLRAVIRTPSGKTQTLEFYENTGAKDEREEEKVYTLSIKTSKKEQGQYTISVAADFEGKQLTFKPDALHAGRHGSEKAGVKIDVPSIHRQRILCVTAGTSKLSTGDEKQSMIHGYNTKDVYVHPQQAKLLSQWKKNHKQ